jgi:hypothetical protein
VATAAGTSGDQALQGRVGHLVERRGLAVVASLFSGEHAPDLATTCSPFFTAPILRMSSLTLA